MVIENINGLIADGCENLDMKTNYKKNIVSERVSEFIHRKFMILCSHAEAQNHSVVLVQVRITVKSN